jgi:hypothetical protein
MGAVYSNALLTIIASAAADGNLGCFIPRDIPELKPVAIDLIHTDERRSRIFLALMDSSKHGPEPLMSGCGPFKRDNYRSETYSIAETRWFGSVTSPHGMRRSILVSLSTICIHQTVTCLPITEDSRI